MGSLIYSHSWREDTLDTLAIVSADTVSPVALLYLPVVAK